MIKRTAILSLLAVLTASAQAYANGNEVDIISDGLSVVCEPSAMIYNQRTMIPVRAVSESIGCMVDWDEATNTATVTDTKNNTVLTVTVNESTMKKTVGEEVSEIEIDTPAMISDNRIFIPVRAVSEALGVTVEWDGVTRTVFMYTDEENFNAYNKNEFNVNGDQIGATCEGMGMTFEEFKSIYKLPEDMPEDTYTHIAERYIKVETLLEMGQSTIEEFREYYGAGEEITGDSLMDEVFVSMDLSNYIGEENLEMFKAEYGFGEEITADTKWGEIRRVVEKADYKNRVKTYGEDKPEDPDEINVYNEGEYDVYGQNVGSVASSMGGSFASFKEMYGLPEDMRKDTYINVAERYIKVSAMLELNAMTIEELREMYGVGEEITEESLMGEVTDAMSLEMYVGAENIEAFKAEYGFGDEVTSETKWGEIRKTVEKHDYEKRIGMDNETEAE